MRARLLHSWPGLTKHFGLRPWEVDLLTPLELDVYLGQLDEIARHNRDTARSRRRRR